MFRISKEDSHTDLTVRIEGRFAGCFAQETKEVIATWNLRSRLVVDLSEVTFADSGGEEVLKWLNRLGGTFIADSFYARHLCERLHLRVMSPLVRERKSVGRPQPNSVPCG